MPKKPQKKKKSFRRICRDAGAALKTFGGRVKDFFKSFKTSFPALCKKIWGGFLSAKSFWTAFAILIILLVLSIVVLFIRLNVFTKLDDRAVSLRSSMDDSLNVFAMEYENATGDITIQGNDGTKVIAPGTDVEYTLRLRNVDKVALQYTFIPQLEFTSEHKLPILVRLLDPEDNYVIGNETTWIPIEEINGTECQGLLLKNQTAEYVFQWKWPYEGDDAYDTLLGSLPNDANVGLDLTFTLHAEADTSIAGNGGFFHSPAWNVILILIIFLLLAIVVTLLLIYIIRWLREKRNQKPVIIEVPVYQTVEVPAEKNEIVARHAVSGNTARINLEDFEHLFFSGDRVTLTLLKQKGIVPADTTQVKILAKTSTRLDKALYIETQKISKNARDMVCRAGGSVTLVAPETGDKKP